MCIARVDTIGRQFQGPQKYGIYQYLQEIRFHRLITGQTSLGFYKNNTWDHPTCFMHWYVCDPSPHGMHYIRSSMTPTVCREGNF